MGYWKAKIDDNNESSIIDFLEVVIHDLDGAAAGIAKKAIQDGLSCLTDQQRQTLDKYAIEPNWIESCKRCSQPIPDSEIAAAYRNGEYCSLCYHKMGKDE